MREILFRGRRTDNKQWVYGFLVFEGSEDNPNPYIVNRRGKYRVTHKTVSQYTGLKDESGERIFEGDIIKSHTGRIFEVRFGQHMDEETLTEANGWFACDYEGSLSLGEDWGGHEVIGNIHDNHELLRGEE